MKFAEAQLESAIVELLAAEAYPQMLGEAIERQLASPPYKFTATSRLADISNIK